MEMYPPPSQPAYHPTAEQLAREQQLRRFNRLYIALPLGLLALVAVGLVVLLLVGVFSPGIVGTEAFISALADIIIILWIMPMLVLMALLVIGFVALRLNRRQKRKLLPEDSLMLRYGRVQPFLWRVEGYLDRADAQVNRAADNMTEPLISNHGRAAAAKAWADILTRPFRKDNQSDGR